MKYLIQTSFFIIAMIFLRPVIAATPTESLKIAVDELLSIAAIKDASDADKKIELTKIIQSTVDFDAVSKRIVSKPWKKATEEQKNQFKALFLVIMTDTYYALLKDYSGEKVVFLKQQLKKSKYAIVDTEIVSSNKKIPVRYRMIKSADEWKIYDFIPEGISLITTYKNSYASILRKQGMSGLLDSMSQSADKASASSKK